MKQTDRTARSATMTNPHFRIGLDRDLPIVIDASWTQEGSRREINEWASRGLKSLSAKKSKRAFLVYDENRKEQPDGYYFPMVSIKNERPVVSVAALQSARSAFLDMDAETLPVSIQKRARNVLDHYFRRLQKSLALFDQYEDAHRKGKRVMEIKTATFIPTEINGRSVTGFPSIFGNLDHDADVTHLGAFAKTLQERLGQIKHLWMHRYGEPPTAVIDEIKEVTRDDLPDLVLERAPDATGGLQVTRTYLKHPLAEAVFEGVKMGAIQEMSFGYDPVVFDFEENDDGLDVRNLREVRLYETSDVNFGSNEATLAAKSFFMPAFVVADQVAAGLKELRDGTLGARDQEQVERIVQMCIGCGAADLKSDDEEEEEAQESTEEATTETEKTAVDEGATTEEAQESTEETDDGDDAATDDSDAATNKTDEDSATDADSITDESSQTEDEESEASDQDNDEGRAARDQEESDRVTLTLRFAAIELGLMDLQGD